MAHVHSQWVPRRVLEESDAINKRKVGRFLNDVRMALPEGVDLLDALSASPGAVVAGADGVLSADGEEEAYNPAYDEVEKVIAQRRDPDGGAPEWLVKWRGLPHASSTWESSLTMVGHQSAIQRWREQSRTPPTPAELAAEARVPFEPDPSRFRPLATSPTYRHGHTLRPHQLDGLNWLLFSWYNKRNVMLADESTPPTPRRAARTPPCRPHPAEPASPHRMRAPLQPPPLTPRTPPFSPSARATLTGGTRLTPASRLPPRVTRARPPPPSVRSGPWQDGTGYRDA